MKPSVNQAGGMGSRTGVGIVLVNWNGSRDTIECLASLQAMECTTGWACCVVDNDSHDDSLASLERYLSGSGHLVESFDGFKDAGDRIKSIRIFRKPGSTVVLVANRINAGFAAANNIGFSVLDAVVRPAFYWVLNNDTMVEPTALQLILTRMALDARIGICGCTLTHTEPAMLVQAYGGVRYSTLTGKGVHVGEGAFYQGPVDNQQIESQITYVSGASMVVTHEFLEKVGPMCEDYFLYNEELDWAWRARGMFKIAVETAAVVHHKEGASIGTHGTQRSPSLLSDFFQARNKLLFSRRYTPLQYPVVYLFILVRALKRLKEGFPKNTQVILSVLLGKDEPDPKWFVRRVASKN